MTAPATSWRRQYSELLRNPALVVWCLTLLLTPVYVFRSGLPQPSDLLVLLLLPLTLVQWNGKLDKESRAVLRALLWFTAWVFLVNIGWAVILGTRNPRDFLIHPLFYSFNVAVFLCALVLARRDRDRFLRISVDMIYLTILVQVIGSFVWRTDLYRGTLFFNSPNQLGFYALLAACLFAMTQKSLGTGRIKASFGVTSCAYLAMLSASRASVAGILVLLFVLLFSNPKTIIFASLVALGLVTLGGPVKNAIEASEQRATQQRNPKLTFAEERGYDRIWNNPEYLVTGAGEGAYDRFTRPGERAKELHSSFGAVLFAYGVVGVVLFLVFGYRVVRGAPLRIAIMLVPALIYTFAHQGLRFTTFWVMVAAFVILKAREPIRSS